MKDNNKENLQIWVVIPAYNEQETITTVTKNVLKVIPSILVVDDASTDQTFAYLSQLPVITLHNSKNLGYVKSLEKGLRYAFAHGAEYAITFDADGQHLSIDVKQFIQLIHKQHPDVIFGNRSFKNRFMEKLFSLYTKRNLRVSDPFCGFRAYKKSFFTRMGGKLEQHYSIGTENTFLYMIKHSIPSIEINLTTLRRQDKSRFAGRLWGNLLELRSSLNLIWYLRGAR